MSAELKEILIREGVTQAELSRGAGVSIGTINRACNDHLLPSPVTQSKILRGLNTLATDNYTFEAVFEQS